MRAASRAVNIVMPQVCVTVRNGGKVFFSVRKVRPRILLYDSRKKLLQRHIAADRIEWKSRVRSRTGQGGRR